MKSRLLFFILAILMAVHVYTQTDIPKGPFPLPEDVETIDGIIKAYYEVVSAPAGQP